MRLLRAGPGNNSPFCALTSILVLIGIPTSLPQSLDRDVGVTVVFGAPMAGIGTVFVMLTRTEIILKTPVSDVRSVYMTDLWARRRLLASVQLSNIR